jgi:hypothetical protein
MARASGEARICRIIESIVRRCGGVVGDGNPGRFEVRGAQFEGSGYGVDGGKRDGVSGCWLGGGKMRGSLHCGFAFGRDDAFLRD